MLERVVEVFQNFFLVSSELLYLFFDFIQLKSVQKRVLLLLKLQNWEWQLIDGFKHRHQQFAELKDDSIGNWIVFAGT